MDELADDGADHAYFGFASSTKSGREVTQWGVVFGDHLLLASGFSRIPCLGDMLVRALWYRSNELIGIDMDDSVPQSGRAPLSC
jgi:hypothetical protein